METRKILALIFSLIFVAAFGFVLSWAIINFNQVKEGMTGTQLYSRQDVDSAFDDGYNTALQDKASYIELIDTYRDTITSQTDLISQINSQNRDYEDSISSLTATIRTHESNVVSLQNVITQNNALIDELETEVANYISVINQLDQQIGEYEASDSSKQAEIQNKQNQINSLNSQVGNLQSLITQLNTTNEMNLSTISTLNTQIQTLNNQISELRLEIAGNDSSVNDLRNQIASLQSSVEYYEDYIASLENDSRVVATFEFNNAVYNIQMLNVGSYATVTTPTSTNYVIFNGWTVDGVAVNLAEYPILENTKFVANVTYKYDVKFVVENNTVSSQIVAKQSYATAPTTPTKQGFDFDGWSVDGVNVVNLNTYKITEDTTFTALFSQKFTVSFVYENTTIDTQIVKGGNLAEEVEVQSTDYKVFNGWLLNGTLVDLSTYRIVANSTFVADISYFYDVEFKVEDSVYSSQLVQKNNYVTIPTAPTINNYKVFNCWLLDGEVVDLTTYKIQANTTFTAQLIYKYDVKLMVDGEVFKTQIVESGTCAISYTPTKTGYSFKGWSLDGTNIVNLGTYPIYTTTTFTAIFDVQKYTLTVSYMNGDPNTTYEAVVGATYTLTPPTLAGHTFTGWHIVEGNGSISGNTFTFVGSNATVIACYDYCYTVISATCYAHVRYNGVTYTLEGSGGGIGGGGGGGTMTCSFIMRTDWREFECSMSDTLEIWIDSGTLMLDYNSDGQVAVQKSGKTYARITWANASFINISVDANYVVLL